MTCSPPNIIYYLDYPQGFIALQLVIICDTTIFSLPADLNKLITFTLTLTNIGTLSIESDRLIYNNISGMIETNGWLNAGQSESIQISMKIPNYPHDIEMSGYGYIDFGRELLLSKAVNNIVRYLP